MAKQKTFQVHKHQSRYVHLTTEEDRQAAEELGFEPKLIYPDSHYPDGVWVVGPYYDETLVPDDAVRITQKADEIRQGL